MKIAELIARLKLVRQDLGNVDVIISAPEAHWCSHGECVDVNYVDYRVTSIRENTTEALDKKGRLHHPKVVQLDISAH